VLTLCHLVSHSFLDPPSPPHRNFLYSLIAGGTVLAGLALAVTAVSNFDPVKRG
jgi:hypothetical protein